MGAREFDRIERLINPPTLIGPDTVILCPPLSVADYMSYIRQNSEHYRGFSGATLYDDEVGV